MRSVVLSALVLAVAVTPSATGQGEKKADLPTRLKAIKGPFTLIVHFEVRKGEEGTIIEAAKPCIEATRKEKGCLAYELHQDAEEPTKFTFFEKWKSPEALAEHMAAGHTKKLLGVLGKVAAGEAKLLLAKSVDDK